MIENKTEAFSTRRIMTMSNRALGCVNTALSSEVMFKGET